MTEIVVLGGGFAGVFAAKELRKRLDREQFRITLVDKNSYHLFTPSLYELATAEEPQRNICIPFSEIFPDGVRIIKGEVQKIDKEKKEIFLKDQTNKLKNVGMSYDYLIIALGSEPNYFNIEGLAQHAITFKTIEEAVEIRDRIREKLNERLSKNENLKVLIGGGGATGVELSAELVKYRRHLCKVHNIPEERIEISLFQRSENILKELHPRIAKLIQDRFFQVDIKIHLGSEIKKVSKDIVEVDGKTYPFDVFIWTGGVKPNTVLERDGLPLNEKKRLIVDKYLKVVGFDNVFAAGDIAGDKPKVAQIAHEQGSCAGANLARLIKGEKLVPYKYKFLGFIIPLSGRFVVLDIRGILVLGILGFIFQQLVFLRYLLLILPPWKAFKRWNRFEGYLAKRM